LQTPTPPGIHLPLILAACQRGDKKKNFRLRARNLAVVTKTTSPSEIRITVRRELA